MKLSPKAEIGAGAATMVALPFFADPVGLAMIVHGTERLHRQRNAPAAAVPSSSMYGYAYPQYGWYRQRNPLHPAAIVALTLLGATIVGGVIYFAATAAKAASLPPGTPGAPADETKLPKLVPSKPPRPAQEVVYHNIDLSGDPSRPGDIHMTLRGSNDELSSHQDLEVQPGDVIAFLVPDDLVAVPGGEQGYEVIPENAWDCPGVGTVVRDTPIPAVTRYRFVVSPDIPRPIKCSVGLSFESVVGAGTYGRFVTISVL